jgi:hypothetical protein
MKLDTKRANDKRRDEFIAEHASKSKVPGDWHWRQAEVLGVQGDYTEGDAAMHWFDNREAAY